jgi:hypothetical protein
MCDDLNLPNKGPLNKEVYLPDNTVLKTFFRTELPFNQLLKTTRDADIIPGLKKSLLSINKMSENGYNTIFHPGEQGVTIHKPNTLNITTSEPPILQGCKQKGVKLWTKSITQDKPKHKALSVYNLPSMGQTI